MVQIDKLEQALEAREALIRWLTKPSNHGSGAKLAKTLDRCTHKHTCGSGACPMCVFLARENLVNAITSIAKVGDLCCVTIVSDTTKVEPGMLKGFDHLNHSRRLKNAFSDLDFNWGLFVTDFSFNEHRTDRYSPFWSIHFHGVVSGIKESVLFKGLKDTFQPSDSIPKPVVVKTWDGAIKALRYLLTSNFDRRIGRDDGTRFNRRSGEMRICRDVDHAEIRVKDRVELLLHLHELGIDGRMSVLNAQRRQVKGRTTIVPIMKGER